MQIAIALLIVFKNIFLLVLILQAHQVGVLAVGDLLVTVYASRGIQEFYYLVGTLRHSVTPGYSYDIFEIDGILAGQCR